MRVTQVTLKQDDDTVELSAMMDDYRLWYRFPADYTITRQGDPFVAAGLLVAMRLGEPLELDVPVSPRLLQGVDRLQDIFRCWGPALKQPFERIAIGCPVQAAETCNEGAASFFSGGVDGWYTLVKHCDAITHLIFAKGIDMQLDNDSLFEAACRANETTAHEYGKSLIPVITNIRFFAHDHDLGWDPVFVGSGLASIALALGFRTTLIPGGMTYAGQLPYGTHYLTDPLWSTEATDLSYQDADVTRSQKLNRLAECPTAMNTLRVCWQDAGYNCGKCEKCLRTMMTLRLLGASTSTLPELASTKLVRRLRINDDNERLFVVDNLQLAEQVGDAEISRLLRRSLRRYVIRRALVDVDDTVCGGWLKRAFRRAVPLPE